VDTNSLQTLGVLLEHAETERDEALRDMQDAKARADQAQAQADQLDQYRRDYQQRWNSQFARQGTMDIVMCYQSFGTRLDQAIAHQAQVVSHANSRITIARELLTQRELRVLSVRKLMERRRHEALSRLARQDQKSTDEQASRAGWGAGHPLTRAMAHPT
jgi:flagellar FliJ protein